MESQPQNPEFRNNPENFHPCILPGPSLFVKVLVYRFPVYKGLNKVHTGYVLIKYFSKIQSNLS